LLLRRYSQNENGSTHKTDTLHIVYHDHDFATRKQLFDDYLEPLKERASREEYDEAWNEVLELSRNSILLFYGSKPETLKEYVNSIRGIGLDLEECWEGYVFKDDAPGEDKQEINRVLTFRRGKAKFADKHATYLLALKAQFGKTLNLREILAEFNKVVQSTEPLKIVFHITVEASLESVSRMNLNRSEITHVIMRYHKESFGASYNRRSMFGSPSFSFGCGGNNLEEMIAFLQFLGYEKVSIITHSTSWLHRFHSQSYPQP
jgi:hypothetical protein